MRRIAIYGKGGIGKSTTASNVSAAMADSGLKVMQIGCDPKADSTRTLLRGSSPPTILETMRSSRDTEKAIVQGYGGIICIECGGPRPGMGCAGRGIIAAFEEIEKKNVIECYSPDVIVYDVLGDVVCGGFAVPIRNGYARDVFIVTSGEIMSLYAAKNIASAVSNFKDDGYARLSGIIQNSRDVTYENDLVDQAALDIGSSVICRIPRNNTIHECEMNGKTVIEGAPDSDIAETYRKLASEMLKLSENSEGGLCFCRK